MSAHDCSFLMLRVTTDTVFRRHTKRKGNQKMECIRNKDRRNNNMLIKHPYVIPMDNNTEEEHNAILEYIESICRGEDGIQNCNTEL